MCFYYAYSALLRQSELHLLSAQCLEGGLHLARSCFVKCTVRRLRLDWFEKPWSVRSINLLFGSVNLLLDYAGLDEYTYLINKQKYKA